MDKYLKLLLKCMTKLFTVCFAFYREMLEQSITELRLTIDELEKRFDTLDDESELSVTTMVNE